MSKLQKLVSNRIFHKEEKERNVLHIYQESRTGVTVDPQKRTYVLFFKIVLYPVGRSINSDWLVVMQSLSIIILTLGRNLVFKGWLNTSEIRICQIYQILDRISKQKHSVLMTNIASFVYCYHNTGSMPY